MRERVISKGGRKCWEISQKEHFLDLTDLSGKEPNGSIYKGEADLGRGLDDSP